MIPPFDKNGLLPPGKPYETSWDEFCRRFGFNDHRQQLLEGLHFALVNLKEAGCRRVYVDGSFVSHRVKPGDWDACWELESVDLALVDPIIIDADFFPDRMKEKYGGDLYLQAPKLPGGNMLAFFQKDRDGTKKKIVLIRLETLP